MGWQDRHYNRGGYGGSDFLGNPAALLSFSIPFGTWFGATVRLHFWLLLSIAFIFIPSLRQGDPLLAGLYVALLIAALLMHEFGHRWAARRVRGWHNEFLLWPAGGMIPPTAPPRPGATFVANIGGIAVNLITVIVCAAALTVLSDRPGVPSFNPLDIFIGEHTFGSDTTLLAFVLRSFALIHFGLILINLLPFYWFDGGYLLQAILWRWLGLYRAVNITCIVGMVIAVPMCLLSLMSMNLFGMLFWGLLFYSSYNRRRQLQASGTNELEDAIAHSAAMRDDEDEPSPRRRRWRRWNFTRGPDPAALRREQQRIDAILGKVHEQGMHSLTWRERRALRKATERQRRMQGTARRTL